MGECECRERCFACNAAEIIISIIMGGIVGVLFFFELILAIIPLLIIELILAGILLITFLGIISIGERNNGLRKCLCMTGSCLFTGIVGTIISGAVAFATGLVIGGILSTIFVALTTMFVILLIIALISFVTCILNLMFNRCRE